jgi:hypothetical protein
MASQPRPSTRSSNPRTTHKLPKQSQQPERRPARAHRDDTPEARRQRQGIPKTHPTRSPSAAREDKP